MRLLILTILVCFVPGVSNSASDDMKLVDREKIVILADFLGKTLEYKKSNQPQQFNRNDQVLFEVTAYPAKEINKKICRDFLLIDYSESAKSGREQKGTACRENKEKWLPANL